MNKKIESTGFMQMGKIVSVIFNSENYEDEVELQLGNYEIVVRDGKTYAVRKKLTYPITYVECCKVLGISYRAQLSYTNPDVERGNIYLTKEKHILDSFMKLRICRNAYWKIAGEEMGLDKPWRPNWISGREEEKYCIGTHCYEIWHNFSEYGGNEILAFPTMEMRDAFYENFKDLIECCKELL